MKIKHLLFTLLIFPLCVFAHQKILNLYAWTGEIPDSLIRQFEKETGIKVNYTVYESNEIMYAKLRASKNAGYDLIMPSSYFADRMRKQGMLAKLDKTKIPNWKYINTNFLNPPYDPGSEYTSPYIWGVTGIFYNKKYYKPNEITKWTDLWDKRFNDKLMMFDDTREMFSIGLIVLGYSINDNNAAHIKQAYEKLKELIPNVKVFSTETVISIMVDEDANAGMSWNGDALKAMADNPDIKFVFPKDGFVIWVDNFAIPVNAPHKDTAHAFINFMQRPDIARGIVLETSYPTANYAGQQLLPPNIRYNPVAYPSKEVLRRGQYQMDLDDATLELYEKYWDKLKMGG